MKRFAELAHAGTSSTIPTDEGSATPTGPSSAFPEAHILAFPQMAEPTPKITI
jgi:hypothetical protein